MVSVRVNALFELILRRVSQIGNEVGVQKTPLVLMECQGSSDKWAVMEAQLNSRLGRTLGFFQHVIEPFQFLWNMSS